MFTQTLKTLKENKLFQNIPETIIPAEIPEEKIKYKTKGAAIYSEGDQSDSIYLILSGEIKIIKDKVLGNSKQEIKYTSDFFGEEDYLEEMPRTSNAIAEEDCKLFIIKKDELNSLTSKNERFLLNLKRIPYEIEAIEEHQIEPQVDESIQLEEIVNNESSLPEFYSSDLKELIDNEVNVPDNDPEKIQDSIIEPEEQAEFKTEAEIIPEHAADTFNLEVEKEFIEENETPEIENFSTQEGQLEEIQEEIEIESLPEIQIAPEDINIKENLTNISLPVENETVMEEVPVPKVDYKGMLKLIEKINTDLIPEKINEDIISSARKIVNAEICLLYQPDESNKFKAIINGESSREIHLIPGQGFAGNSYSKKAILRINDDEEIPGVAKELGLTDKIIKNILCLPIINKSNKIIAVLELINSNSGNFSEADEESLSLLSTHYAVAIENALRQKELIKEERLAVLSKFGWFLSSDIKKPVLVSKRYTEHLKSKKPAPEIINVLDMILEQLNHLSDLILATSGYSISNLSLQPLNTKLNDALEEIFSKLESYITIRNCEIIKHYDSRNPNVMIDKKAFSICCMHLLRNSCDSMADGGKIEVSTTVEKNTARISFKDSGKGIPDNLKEKIFEPFESFDKIESSGLGLPVSKKIIEDHGGTITFVSSLGQGTEFNITLPFSF